jgi:hypothetical protein
MQAELLKHSRRTERIFDLIVLPSWWPHHFGVSNFGFFDRLWIGIMDIVGAWWPIRRKKPTPVATEVTSHD